LFHLSLKHSSQKFLLITRWFFERVKVEFVDEFLDCSDRQKIVHERDVVRRQRVREMVYFFFVTFDETEEFAAGLVLDVEVISESDLQVHFHLDDVVFVHI